MSFSAKIQIFDKKVEFYFGAKIQILDRKVEFNFWRENSKAKKSCNFFYFGAKIQIIEKNYYFIFVTKIQMRQFLLDFQPL